MLGTCEISQIRILLISKSLQLRPCRLLFVCLDWAFLTGISPWDWSYGVEANIMSLNGNNYYLFYCQPYIALPLCISWNSEAFSNGSVSFPSTDKKVRLSSVAKSCLTLCDPMDRSILARLARLAITNSWSLLKLMSIKSVMPSNHLILCRPLLFLPSIFPSIRVFSNESVLHIRWPKYWSFSFNISPSNEHPGLISFRMDWLDLRAVQGTLKSLLQHHSSKASILPHSAF